MAVITITLPGTRPSGDDLQWKREVATALQQIQQAIAAINTQLVGR